MAGLTGGFKGGAMAALPPEGTRTIIDVGGGTMLAAILASCTTDRASRPGASWPTSPPSAEEARATLEPARTIQISGGDRLYLNHAEHQHDSHQRGIQPHGPSANMKHAVDPARDDSHFLGQHPHFGVVADPLSCRIEDVVGTHIYAQTGAL